MIPVPHTYSEWISVINLLKNRVNDEDVLIAMQKGTLEWQSGVADRFSRKLIEAVNGRMNTASDKFQRDMNNAHGMEGAIVQALLSLRKELLFLTRVVNIQALPVDYRKQYIQLIIDQANNIQDSLEDSAKKDRSGKMSSIVRNHKVNAI